MKTLTIYTPEKFNYTVHRWFREASALVTRETTVEVNFSNTKILDSSALGMLLLLRDKAGTVVLTNSTKEVRDVLKIANFQKLFKIV